MSIVHSLARLTACLVIVATPLRAQPDVRQMSGIPLPVADLAQGTVTVRVLRGSLANPISSQTVEILGAGSPISAVTNDAGRAEFTGLRAGTRVKAAATVAGDRLESQEFAVPATGGIRLMLVAADSSAAPAAPAPAAAAAPGTVLLGDDSRFVFEAGEDGLSVFYILQVQNASDAPVQPPEPVQLDLPADARGATILEGSSKQATLAGRQLRIAGPFAPGPTLVQVAYTLPYGGSNLVIEQRLPLKLMHLAIVAQKIGDMRLASAHIAEQRDMPAQGNLYIAARGGEVAAGEVLRFDFSGMPHHASWPRALALALAAAVLAAGVFWSLNTPAGKTTQSMQRQQLEERRNRLFDELTALEIRHREKAVDPERYADRRRELVAALERVYVALGDELALSR